MDRTVYIYNIYIYINIYLYTYVYINNYFHIFYICHHLFCTSFLTWGPDNHLNSCPVLKGITYLYPEFQGILDGNKQDVKEKGRKKKKKKDRLAFNFLVLFVSQVALFISAKYKNCLNQCSTYSYKFLYLLYLFQQISNTK